MITVTVSLTELDYLSADKEKNKDSYFEKLGKLRGIIVDLLKQEEIAESEMLK